MSYDYDPLSDDDVKAINMICENAIAELPLCLSFEIKDLTELYNKVEVFALKQMETDKKYKITIEEVTT